MLYKLKEEAEKEDSKDANKSASIEQLLDYLAKFDAPSEAAVDAGRHQGQDGRAPADEQDSHRPRSHRRGKAATKPHQMYSGKARPFGGGDIPQPAKVGEKHQPAVQPARSEIGSSNGKQANDLDAFDMYGTKSTKKKAGGGHGEGSLGKEFLQRRVARTAIFAASDEARTAN